MASDDELDEKFYDELFDYEKAAANASIRFDIALSEERGGVLYRQDGQFRYWVYIYMVAIDLFGPDPSDFKRLSCQSEILRFSCECGQPELNDLFPKARNTAWKEIVLMAERTFTGEDNPERFSIKKKMAHVDIGLIGLELRTGLAWQDAWERLMHADRLSQLESFGGIQNRIKNSRPKENHFLHAVIFSHWIHPDCPLWLMQITPALKVAKMLRELWGVSATINRKAFEQAKKRLVDNKQLVTNRPAVIKDVSFRVDGRRCVTASYEFTKTFSTRLAGMPSSRIYG